LLRCIALPGQLIEVESLSGDFVKAVAVNEARVQWVDCCKGLCILFVVYGHIVGGLEAAGVLRSISTFLVLRDWVYLFHIPAFFFLSGLFAQRACDQPFVSFVRGRLRVLFYPYLVWTAIFLLSQFVMGRFVNTPPSLSRALRCLWEPYGVGLWFLYTLFLISIFFASFRRWRIPPVPILLICLVGYILSHYYVFGFWYVLNESMSYSIFFMIGGCYPGILSAPVANVRRPLLMAAGVGLFVLMTLSQVVHLDAGGLLKLSRALLGIAGVVLVAMAVARTVAAGLFASLGTYSLEIYLAHPLWGTASRAILLRSGVHAPLVFVVCGVLLGVTGSVAMAVLCKRFEFPYLFRWPAGRPRSAGAGAPSGRAQAS
jgi:fucose 4-O-acetylase-like acetyltransferase